MLFNVLKTKAQIAMTQFLEGVNRETDVDTHFEDFMNDFVGTLYTETYPWWDFSEDDLSVKDINELLLANADLWEKSSEKKPWSPTSVKELLRRYGIWAFREGHQKEFGSMFLQGW